MPLWLTACVWGLAIGSGLFLGAMIAFHFAFSHLQIATVMGFGGGVLVVVLSTGLMEEAYHYGGFIYTTLGFIGGGALFSTVNWLLSKRGAQHRKRCGECVGQPSETEVRGSGLAIAVGSIMDAIPEAFVVGLNLVGGASIGKAVLAGFFIANIPQGLSSASGMKEAGRSGFYILGVWSSIFLLSGATALFGFSVFNNASPQAIASSNAFAAGAILAMLAETMIPEAFQKSHNFMGLITGCGFIFFFLLTKMLS
ncbi:MAG: ZIP family zinc transporter [Deltaproteobacteria bacterium]|nr:ZIP family zinc transporter [Deltaproteobacteria bacterium]